MGVKNRIDFCALKLLVTSAMTALALSAPVTLAQPSNGAPQNASAHPGATDIGAKSLFTKASSKATKPTPNARRPRAKTQTTPLTAPTLKLETREAARQVVRNDHAAHQ